MKVEIMMLSIGEVAKMFGVGKSAARGWARRGLLKGAHQQKNGEWCIPLNAAENFVPPERGRPLEGRSIRFKLSRNDGKVFVAMAKQSGLTTQELAKKLVIAAAAEWILDGCKV